MILKLGTKLKGVKLVKAEPKKVIIFRRVNGITVEKNGWSHAYSSDYPVMTYRKEVYK